MENRHLMLYGETIAVYCNTHTKRKHYGQNVFFVCVCFKIGGIISNYRILNANCTIYIYIYIYCIKTTWTLCLIILTIHVSLEAVLSFETSG